MKLQMSFGENLINLRKQKGWSQDDLADNLNLSRQAISKWENDTSKPDIDNIKKISKVFSVTIDDLLNNDVVKDKAVTLNVKKQEKKEKTITIVKCMIIAVIILYIINVIFKFASLLLIVNGIQKYANLSNYHYVITTYDETGLVEKEECWFKDGITITNSTAYNKNDIEEELVTAIDYNANKGYIKNNINNTYDEINIDQYLSFHKGYNVGKQLYSCLLRDVGNMNVANMLIKAISLNKVNIKIGESVFTLNLNNTTIVFNNDKSTPIITYNISDDEFYIKAYNIEINNIENISI